MSELLARIEALARRGAGQEDSRELWIADLRLDLRARRAERAGKPIALQPREFRLIPRAAPGAGRDADHAARGGLGLLLRSADQCHRRPNQPPAPKNRQRFLAAIAPYGPRHRLYDLRRW